MIIALSVWNERIAPVFDVAMELLLIEIHDSKIVKKNLEVVSSLSMLEKTKRLQQLGINVLICGAVSEQLKSFLDMYEINVTSFISGNVEKIIELWVIGKFDEADFAMPGCGKQKGSKNKQRLHCRRNRKINNYEL